MKNFTNSGQFKYGQNVVDLTGKKYGKLTVLRRADKDDEFYKLGISEKKSTRARDEGYRKYLFEPDPLTRCEVWTIEQLILNDSVRAKPRVMPKRFEKMEGKWELRYKDTFNLNFYRQKYYEYLEELQSLGWEELYLNRFNY